MNRVISLAALFILLGFGAYSVWVTGTHREPWAMQMLLDLTIACLLYSLWLTADARRHGISPWP